MALKTVRIQDVAQAARVSTATVSRALSTPEKLSEETRKAVFDAIRSTGYRVNHAARNLRMQRTGAVLILVPNLSNPFFSQILAGISGVFMEERDIAIGPTRHSGIDQRQACVHSDHGISPASQRPRHSPPPTALVEDSVTRL